MNGYSRFSLMDRTIEISGIFRTKTAIHAATVR